MSEEQQKQESPHAESPEEALARLQRQFENAHSQFAGEYTNNLLRLAFSYGVQEVESMRKTIKTPDGGIYLLQLQHVDGPKVNVQKLYKRKETTPAPSPTLVMDNAEEQAETPTSEATPNQEPISGAV